ncbi:MAG: metallophosphoesterase, partial [Victivallaceae bacterium]
MRLPGMVGDTRRKFSHRLKDWHKVTGYDQRPEYCSGKIVSAVKYHLATGIPELAGTRLAFVSDLHWEGGSATEKLMCEEMNAFIAEFKPEYLLFGGDAITYTCNLSSAIEVLKNLPVDSPARIAVMGNWERSKKWLTIQDWKAFYRAANFKLIVNEEYEDNKFLFFGIDDIKTGKPVFSGEKPAG